MCSDISLPAAASEIRPDRTSTLSPCCGCFAGCVSGACEHGSLKPLTRPPARRSGCVWSSAVNHRFDFAYLEDAVTRANSTTTTTTLCLSLSSPLSPSLLPYTYQLLRSLLILSLPCLYLAVRTKPKPARPPHSINGISAASLFLFFLLHMSTGF